MGLLEKKIFSKNFAARIISRPGFKKTASNSFTVGEGYYATSFVAWAPHRGCYQQSQHLQLLDHGLLIRAHGSKNERFAYFFTKETQNCPITSISCATYSRVIIGVERRINIDVYVIGHWPLDGAWQVCHQLALKAVQGRNSVVAQLETITGYVLGQNPEAVSGTSPEELATGKLQSASQPFTITLLQLACIQDGVQLIAQILNPLGSVVYGCQALPGHLEIEFHPEHFTGSVVIDQFVRG